MRRVVQLGVVLLGAAIACLGFVPGAHADGTVTVTSGLVADAWYVVPSATTCTAAVGCPPVNPGDPVFPAGSFHEQVTGGQEAARAYVIPDISALPADATDVGGKVVLPLDTDPSAGTADPAGAALLACLTTSPVTDGQHGSAATAPTVDCKHSTRVTITTGSAPAATFDLAPFLPLWQQGVARMGVALVPDPAAAPPATWSLTFDGHAQPGVAPPTVTVTYTTATPPPSTGPSVAAGGPVPPPTVTAPSVPPVVNPQVVTPAVPDTRPPTLAAQVPQRVAYSANLRYEGFRYSAVFLLPLALGGAGVFLCRMFLTDAIPAGRGRS